MTPEQARMLVKGYTAERYAAELPVTLLKALADAPCVPENEITDNTTRYIGKGGPGRKSYGLNRKKAA